MADYSSPLLNSNTSSSSNINPDNSPPCDDSTMDDIIEPYLKNLRWHQILQAILGFIPVIFEALQTFVSIFTEANPTWHCTELRNTTCNTNSNICYLPEGSWSYDKPAYTSIISEWSLDCTTDPIIRDLPTLSFFIGCLFSGVALIFIGDSIGRKNMLFLSSLLMSVSSFLNAFSNDIWVYSGLRFISGIGRAAIGTCAIVLATESVGKKWQGKFASLQFIFFATGSLLLPAIAYLVRSYSWRVIYLIISVPGILYCLVLHFFAYESPKWLLAQGREHEAREALKAFGGPETWKFSVISANENQGKGIHKPSFFRILTESRTLRKRFFLLISIGFGIGVVYYGVILGLVDLDFDLYWGIASIASLQILPFLVVFFTETKLKRRVSILVFTMISGVCCVLLCIIVGKMKVLEVGLELVSFFSASTAIYLLLIYTTELIPVHARNTVVAMVWQVWMLGGVISPVLNVALGNNSFILYGIFGVSVLATGGFVVFLHETLEGKEEQVE